MGRTVLPFTRGLYREEESWGGFRRALRRGGRGGVLGGDWGGVAGRFFDALSAAPRYHPAACTCAGRAVPFDAILMSILVEERRAARELSRRVEELERLLAGRRGECPDGS